MTCWWYVLLVLGIFEFLPSLVYCKWNKNVIVIIGDDAGYETGVYNNTVCQTPFLDRLAANGLTFKHAFTSVSSCSPSRSAILSGLPQHQNGMFGLHHQPHNFNSFNDVQSLPLLLKRSGISTGIIGKKHVGPEETYPFDYSQTEENNSIMQVGRNITLINQYVKDFLTQTGENSFFLYIGFHDPHRCSPDNVKRYGPFCNKFGDGSPEGGRIPDWKPVQYRPEDVDVPYFVQDTPAARADIAAQYTTYSRMDQGIGLILKSLKDFGHSQDTLVIYTADNGIPFTSGRTNLYDPGMREPFIVHNPDMGTRRNEVSEAFASLLDIVPTVLDWYDITYIPYKLMKVQVNLTGHSLLPVTYREPTSGFSTAFASQSLHEITMYYPMRVVRTPTFKLIHNMNYRMPFGIDQDFFYSQTFQDILNRTEAGAPLPWYKNLTSYYYRPQWELYSLKDDPKEMRNVADDTSYKSVMTSLREKLEKWQRATSDPWLCSPAGVLNKYGDNRYHPTCGGMHSGV